MNNSISLHYTREQLLSMRYHPLSQVELNGLKHIKGFTIPKRLLKKKNYKSDAISILNKLTPEKYDTLSSQFIKTLQFADKTVYPEIIDIYFKKAEAEKHFAEIYAELAGKLYGCNRDFTNDLVEKTKEEFNTYTGLLAEKYQEIIKDVDEFNKQRKLFVSLAAFMGNLYRNRLLQGNYIIFILGVLMNIENDISYEFACELIKIVSQTRDGFFLSKLQTFVNNFYKKRNTKGIGSKVKFAMDDINELKDNKWKVFRNSQIKEKPKKLQELKKRRNPRKFQKIQKIQKPLFDITKISEKIRNNYREYFETKSIDDFIYYLYEYKKYENYNQIISRVVYESICFSLDCNEEKQNIIKGVLSVLKRKRIISFGDIENSLNLFDINDLKLDYPKIVSILKQFKDLS